MAGIGVATVGIVVSWSRYWVVEQSLGYGFPSGICCALFWLLFIIFEFSPLLLRISSQLSFSLVSRSEAVCVADFLLALYIKIQFLVP